MPISGGKYVAPLWVDNAPPALDAAELQAMSDSVASYADPVAQIPWFTRPNLLDNWYFVGGGSQQGGGQFPVNSLGKTSYSGAVYGIDRWKSYSSSLTTSITSNGYKETVNSSLSSGSRLIYQPLDAPAMYAGKTVTASALVSELSVASFRMSILYVVGGTTTNNTVNFTSTGLFSKTVTIPSSITSLMVAIQTSSSVSADSYVTLSAVKLEIGDTQTLAHQENGSWVLNEIPNFDEQFMRCVVSPDVPMRIEYGSYVGTGTSGSSNPSSLTFGFVPKRVMILDSIATQILFSSMYGCPSTDPNRTQANYTYTAHLTWSGTTLEWYAENTNGQMNIANHTYYYLAIG